MELVFTLLLAVSVPIVAAVLANRFSHTKYHHIAYTVVMCWAFVVPILIGCVAGVWK